MQSAKLCAECGAPLANQKRKYCSYACQYSLASRRKMANKRPRTKTDSTAGLALSKLPIELISPASRKMRVVIEQNHACNGCGLTTWRGQPITLELEHKDGNRCNDARENLEALCPNCHSQTPTWRGRNKRRKATDDEMRSAILNTPSLCKALSSLGMAAKGKNYVRIARLANEMVEGLARI